MQDWRIGRLLRTVHRTVDLSLLGNVNIPANTNRVGIEISLTSQILVVTDSLAPANFNAEITLDGAPIFCLDVFNRKFSATLLTHGDLPTRAVSIVDNDYANLVSITEWFMPEDVITASINQFIAENPKWQK